MTILLISISFNANIKWSMKNCINIDHLLTGGFILFNCYTSSSILSYYKVFFNFSYLAKVMRTPEIPINIICIRITKTKIYY
jgi:hypothetical protein